MNSVRWFIFLNSNKPAYDNDISQDSNVNQFIVYIAFQEEILIRESEFIELLLLIFFINNNY